MSEKLHQGKSRESALEGKERTEKLRNLPQESENDLHAKEAFLSFLSQIKPKVKENVDTLRKLVMELRESEMSKTNFVSPENMLGLSTLVRWDGKTFSSDRLETVEQVYETNNLRLVWMVRLEGMITSGWRLEQIRKDPSVAGFLASPEGRFVEGLALEKSDQQTLEDQYNLEKARELRDKIIRGDELAQDWYDKLKGTPLEKIAEAEKMQLWDQVLRKWREFANSMLGLDSLAALVAGAWLGRALGTLISKSESLSNLSLKGVTLLNESKVARIAMPWVNAISSKAWESGLMALSKWSGNFLAEIAKGFAYTELARWAGGEKMAHAMSYPLMFIPWLKGQFESSLKVSLANNPANFSKFKEWVTVRYGTPEKLEEAIRAGMKESYNRSKWNVGVEEAKKIFESAKEAAKTLFEKVSQAWSTIRTPISNHAGVRAGVAEGAGSSIAEETGSKVSVVAGLAEEWGSIMANAPKALSVTPNPKPVETAQPKSDAHTTENPQELPRENGSIPPKTEQNVPKPVPKELSEIRTEKEFEQFVRTVFEEHGALSLENQNQVVQSLLYKWKEYSKLAVKNQSKVGSPEVPSSRDSPGSFLDTEGAIPIDPSKLKRELVAYVDGMRTVSQLMDGIDNWALMSSNSLFLAKKEYRYIPDDFDISIDRKDIGKAWRQLQKLVASWKVENVHKKAIVGHEKLYPERIDVPDADIARLIEAWNFKIVFDLKTKTGKPIETEFFIEDKGRGFTQIGHMDRTIESVSIKGKEIKYLSEKDAVEGYLVNLADEGPKNNVETFAKALEAYMEKKAQGKVSENELFKPPKAKDGTRNLNVLFFLEDPRVRSPEQVYPALLAVTRNFRKQWGENLSPALESILKPENLEAVKKNLGAVIRDFRKLPEERALQKLPDFEAFRDKLILWKQEVAEIYLKASKNQLTNPERLLFKDKLSIMETKLTREMDTLGQDNLSFAYYYELHKFKFGFIKHTIDELNLKK